MGHTSEHVIRRDSQANHIVLRFRHYGLTFANPNGRMEVAGQKVVWTTALKELGRVGTGVYTGRLQIENATIEECRNEEKASTRQAAKGRGGEKAAITHWPCNPEPRCLLH